jgi:hypothetical protein
MVISVSRLKLCSNFGFQIRNFVYPRSPLLLFDCAIPNTKPISNHRLVFHPAISFKSFLARAPLSLGTLFLDKHD